MIKRLVYIFISIFIISSISTLADECQCSCCCCHKGTQPIKEVKDGTVLSIQDCISIGLKNSPIIKYYKYNLDLAKSNVGIARSAYFPTLSAGVGYNQYNNSNTRDNYSLYRELPSVGVALNKMIWDFGRTTATIKMEEFYRIGAEYQFMDSVCDSVFRIKTKYYTVLREKSLVNAEYINKQLNQHIEDVMRGTTNNKNKTTTDLLNAQVIDKNIDQKIIEVETDYKNSIADLNNAMYYIDAPNYRISNTDTFNDTYKKNKGYKLISYIRKEPVPLKIEKSDKINNYPTFKFDNAIDIAYKNSPDLQVLLSTKHAMEQSLLAVKRSYYPSLNADVGYNLANSNQYTNNNLTIGVNLTSTLNAQELKYEIKAATAQINIADTEIEKFKKDLYFQVQKALNNVDKNSKQIPIAEKNMDSASEDFEQTLQNYKNGKMNQIELQCARELYYDSIKKYINTVYEYNISVIDLEIALHYHLIDIHDRAEHAIKYHDEEIINNFSDIMNCKKHDKK